MSFEDYYRSNVTYISQLDRRLELMRDTVVGPAARVAQALAIVESEIVDIALLDVNLGQEKSYPIADHLLQKGIPVLLSTGYAALDPPYDQYPRLQKPYCPERLAQSLEIVLASAQNS